MATIIRRHAEMGDPRLVREPFPEPGPQPLIRLSSLSHQGGDGDALESYRDVAQTSTLYRPSDGVAPVYRVPADGVPGLEFDQTAPGVNPARKAGLHRANSGGTVVRTHIAVVKFDRHPTAPQGAGENPEARVLAAYYSGNAEGIYVLSTTHASNPGCVVARGAAGAGSVIIGPEMPLDGRYHFIAAVMVGATSRLHLDSGMFLGSVNANFIGPHMNIGNSLSGAKFQVVEAAQYSTALTVAQLEEKRAHYRSLYQF